MCLGEAVREILAKISCMHSPGCPNQLYAHPGVPKSIIALLMAGKFPVTVIHKTSYSDDSWGMYLHQKPPTFE